MKSPNFLNNFWPLSALKGSKKITTLVLFFLVVSLISIIVSSYTLAIVFLILCLVLFFTEKLDLGFLLFVFLSFFIGWQIALADYLPSFFPILSSLNAAIGEYFVVILFLSFLLSLLFYQKRIEKLEFPGLKIYGLFLVVVLVSALLNSRENTDGIRQFFRWWVFVYLFYIIFPYYLIEKKETIIKVFKVFFATGLLLSVYGIISLFLSNFTGWHRAIPFSFWGFAPLGTNHNSLAEALITILPAGIYLYLISENKKKYYFFGTILIVLVTLLTLSRAAWLCLFLQALMIYYFFQDKIKFLALPITKKLKILSASAAVLLLVYMGLFVTSAIVQNSTVSRLEMTKFVMFYFEKSPLIGHGPGSYIEILKETKSFILDYGDPLEAHGFIQKIVFEEGLFGLIFFTLFLVWVILQIRKKQIQNNNPVYSVLMIMVVGAVVFQLFNTSYNRPVMWLPIGIALAAMRFEY